MDEYLSGKYHEEKIFTSHHSKGSPFRIPSSFIKNPSFLKHKGRTDSSAGTRLPTIGEGNSCIHSNLQSA